MNILQVPNSISHFLGSAKLSALACTRALKYIPLMLTGIILGGRKKTQATLAKATFVEKVDKATISRILRMDKPKFKSRDIYTAFMTDAIQRQLPKNGEPVTWMVAIDGTSTKRGGFTKIKGANNYKAKNSKTKARTSKAHTWLMGILITEKGVRIPLPRYICFPVDYVKPGRPPLKHLTQQDLTILMLKELLKLMPENIQLVVLGDEYFECNKIGLFAQKHGVIFIAPCAKSRCFANENDPRISNKEKIHDRGKELSAECFSSFSEVVLFRGNEDTASYRRYSARQTGPKDYRCYLAYHECRAVAGLGPVGVVYSYKSPVHEKNKKNFEKMTFKTILCSDASWPAEKVVEWFECRWTAIEIYFRELKQELGFEDYVGLSVKALERYVDLVLLSFLYLELNRLTIMHNPGVPDEVRKKASFARTQGMCSLVRWQAKLHEWKLIQKSWKSERTKRLLKGFYTEIAKLPDTISMVLQP